MVRINGSEVRLNNHYYLTVSLVFTGRDTLGLATVGLVPLINRKCHRASLRAKSAQCSPTVEHKAIFLKAF
jgi:hypothetical protein